MGQEPVFFYQYGIYTENIQNEDKKMVTEMTKYTVKCTWPISIICFLKCQDTFP